jgi:hypothetical protein
MSTKNSHIIAMGLTISVALLACAVLWLTGCDDATVPARSDVVTVRSIWFDGYSRTALIVEFPDGATRTWEICGIPPVWVGMKAVMHRTWDAPRSCFWLEDKRT